MKVLVYRSSMLPFSQTFVKDHIEGLKDFEPMVVAMEELNELKLKNNEIKGLFSPGTGKIKRRILNLIYWKTGIYPKNAFDHLKDEKPNLVHAHFGPDGLEVYPFAKIMGIPLIVTLHGYDINISKERWEKNKFGKLTRYPKMLLEMAKDKNVYFVAVSEAIRQQAVKFGIPEERIFVRYLGIRLDDFEPGDIAISDRPRRILFVGRLVEKKACDVLIKAVANIKDQVAGIELVVIGDGPLRNQYEELASALGVEVKFKGVLTSKGVKAEINRSRVFCLPSVTASNGDAEGLGIVNLEAQACGVPAVTSAKGGAEEGVVDGVTGYSFAEHDIEALSQILKTVLLDEKLNQELGTQAVKFIRDRFDHSKCTKELEELYKEIILQERE